MILLSQTSQAADIRNREFGEPPSLSGGLVLPLPLCYRHGTWLDADAMNEVRIKQSPSADPGHARLGGGIAELRGRKGGARLTNEQLDTIAAGLAARAAGTAQAEGAETESKVDVLTTLGQPGPQNALSMGRATANASASTIIGPATASSTLTLAVTVP